MTIWIYPYNRFSRSARNLANATGYRRYRGSRQPRPGDTVFNWGSSEIPFDTQFISVFNGPARTKIAANKLHLFREITDNVRTVPWTEDKGVAAEWLDTSDVVARTVLTGHSGNGIVIVQQNEELVNAPLYTKYIKKAEEYRVHVAFGDVIDVQRKIRDPRREPANWQVRSHQNGFIYIRGGVTLPDDVRTQATKAIECAQVEYGAVDVITTKSGTAYVLEINCAPGLEGQTVQAYASAFKAKLGA